MTVFQRPSGSLALKETNSEAAMWYFHCTVSKKRQVKQDLVNFSQTSPVKSTAWEICTDTVNKSQPYPVTKKHRRINMYIHAFSFYSKFLHTCNGHCKNIIGKQTCYSSPNKWNLFFWEFLLFCRNTCDFFFFFSKTVHQWLKEDYFKKKKQQYPKYTRIKKNDDEKSQNMGQSKLKSSITWELIKTEVRRPSLLSASIWPCAAETARMYQEGFSNFMLLPS